MFGDEEEDFLEVYNYYRDDNEGEPETVPSTVQKLIVHPGVQILPTRLCYNYERLRQVSLPHGLTKIRACAFYSCKNLVEIKICRSVKFIGFAAFLECTLLAKVEFDDELSPSLPHQLVKIARDAFHECTSLLRIKLPSSVTSVGRGAFKECTSLIEANLSTTRLTKIEESTFNECTSLQTVSLPNTLEQIDRRAFDHCYELVTLVIPLDSQSITIVDWSFTSCKKLANLVLPQGSTAEDFSFYECEALHQRYGIDRHGFVECLVSHFYYFPVHKMCYDHSTTNTPELRRCMAEKEQEEGGSLLVVEGLGMTPFHVLFSTSEPRMELLDVLLESPQSNQLLRWKDINGKRPVDYLMNNWTDGTASLVQRTLQKWMIDRVARWGSSSTEDMQSKVQEMLSEDDKERRNALYGQLYALMEQCETVEAISILEMALWKWNLKSGWTSGGVKRPRPDREECRRLSGSDIPPIASFLGIQQEVQQRTSD